MPYFSQIKTGICFTALCLLVSCSALKPAQLHAVERYTMVTKGITTIPSDIYFRVYQLRSQAQSIQLSGVIASNESESESIEALQLDFTDKFKFLDLVDSFSYAYRIIANYADMVHALISESYLKEFTKNKKGWQSSFDGLVTSYNAACVKRVPAATKIPPSVGKIVSGIIQEIGKVKIKALQKKYLKAAITTAHEPFVGICDDFLNTDIPKIKRELVGLPSFINENYKDFLNHLKNYESQQGNNAYNYYKSYIPIYSNWQLQLKELNDLVTKLGICILSLRNGYTALETYISSENVNAESPAELKKLDQDYVSLLETIARFSDAREKLFKISY